MNLDKAPAASLRLYIIFSHALVPGPTTDVSVYINTAPNSYVQQFTGGQTLTIDGVSFGARGSASIPRHPQGGAGFYALTYTDEHGKQTIAHIPAPQTDLAILQPTPGGRVPLPRLAKTSHPQPVATLPTYPSDQYLPRPPELADTPLTVRYTLPYTPASPPDATGNATTSYDVLLSARSQCASGWPRCDPRIDVDEHTPTGTVTFDDKSRPYGHGFETFATGPVTITASMEFRWRAPDSGFQSLDVNFYNNTASAPIT